MTAAVSRPEAISSMALKSPAFEALKGKRVILASSSPRRKQILESVVSGASGVRDGHVGACPET